LALLLPELIEDGLPALSPRPLPAEQGRRLMFAAVRRFLGNIAGPAGTLLVLDDLQWAGPDALELVAELVRSRRGGRLRVLGAYRLTEIQPASPLAMAKGDLAAAGLAAEVELGPLEPQEAAELLAALVHGAVAAGVMEQVLRRAGGVPFFLVSYAQGLRSAEVDRGEAAAVPHDVVQSIRQRVAVLPENAQHLLGAAAVAGGQATRRVLMDVAGRLGQDERESLAALEAAGGARLLLEAGDETYQFTHELVREVVLAGLSAARRATLHRWVAEALARGPGESPIEALALHYRQAGEPERAIPYLEQAGDRAWSLRAYGAAASHFADLIELLARLGRAPEVARAREKLGSILLTLAQYGRARRELEQAVEAYCEAGDQEGQARAVAQIGWVDALRGAPEEGIARLQLLLGQPGLRLSAHSLAALHDALAQLFVVSGRYGETLAAAARAVELATEAADERLLSQAQMCRGTALLLLGRLEECVQVLEGTVAAVERVGGLRDLASSLNNLAMAYRARGQFDRDQRYVERALEVAERLGDPPLTAYMWCNRGEQAYLVGDWERAHDCYERALRLVGEVDTSWASPYPSLGLGQLALARGEGEIASAYLEEVITLAGATGDLDALQPACCALAERDLLEGRPAVARARLEPLLDRPTQQDNNASVLPVLAWAVLDLGDEGWAEGLLAGAVERARAEQNRVVLVEALRIQAMAVARAGRWPEARAALEEALVLCRSMPCPYAEARVIFTYGLVHSHQHHAALAREQLQAARAILSKLGERLYGEPVECALAALAQGDPPMGERPTTG
jgi:tetratricopeptide (TPR) repeat protein